MGKKEEIFLKRIQATFRIEAQEHLLAFSSGLIELEKTQPKERVDEITETMFREIHSLKGAARSVNQTDAESVCQTLESVFSALKRNEISLSPSCIGLFYRTVDCLTKIIAPAGTDQTIADRQIEKKLIQQLKEMVAGKLSENSEKAEHIKEIQPVATAKVSLTEIDLPAGTSPESDESVRIRISKLAPLLLIAEELIQRKNMLNHNIIEFIKINNEIVEFMSEFYRWKGHQSNIYSTLWNTWIKESDFRFKRLENRIAAVTSLVRLSQNNFNGLIDNHIDAIKQLIMLPVSSIVEIFPGMVREIAKDQNKEIEFIIKGTELEIDRRILEELKDPLIHLIRNSIDHGIGKPNERVLQNKPVRGNITLDFAAKDNGYVVITLSDDGNGIDKEDLLKAAIKSGILSDESAGKLETEDVMNLIYKSGVSTSPIITNFSGRGLGLAIVHEKIAKLNGEISLETEVNSGTTVRILLPITIATFRGIMVKVEGFIFMLPTMNVELVMKVEQEEIKTVEYHETLLIDNQIISVLDLGETLGLSEHKYAGRGKIEQGSPSSKQIRIIVLFSAEHRIAFKVDEIVDEQQVLVKGLGKLLHRVKNISGAAILDSGKVIPVLNITDLMKSAIRITGRNQGRPDEKKSVIKTGKILVVEDSITSRTMLKNILETSGYKVVTAIDGLEGFTKARSGEFDLILSDVDMPVINGFELTAKIREDLRLNKLPVILLTSLESREDREHGIEVGADAYILKSSFDQGCLLEVIKKLIGSNHKPEYKNYMMTNFQSQISKFYEKN